MTLVGEAAVVMSEAIRALAMKRPDLKDCSGKAFWPVPAQFPGLLTHTLHRLQEHITQSYLDNDRPMGDFLAAIRVDLLKIAYNGDLGENHTDLFLADHPNCYALSAKPFARFCMEIKSINDPIILLGIITRNEEGSIAEAEALVQHRLIRNSKFAEVHLVEEKEHARIAASIRSRLENNPSTRDAFLKGQKLHDTLYHTILDGSP